jgi:acyl-CoA thioester hydrolase
MPMFRYTLARRVSHADVDFLGELKVSALLGLLEQAAVEASTAVGFDPAWYTRAGRVWIIRRTQIERIVPVGGEHELEVETAIADFRRARSLRRYTARCRGTVVAEATTDWVYCETSSGRPVRIPEDVQRAFAGGEAVVMLPRPGPVSAPGNGAPALFELTVQPSHLDHVVHVNNAVYANFLEDGAFALFAAHGWPLQRMLDASGGLRPRTLDVEYLSDAQMGERLQVSTWLSAGAALTAERCPPAAALVQTITAADGRAIIRAHSQWVWRQRPAVLGGVPV